MAAETVETLELEIRAKAESAASKIADLSASVSDFGEKISKYIANMNSFATALEKIVEAAGKLNGIKNVKDVIGSAAMAASRAKSTTYGKAFEPIIPPVRASNTVNGRTRVVNWAGQGPRRFNMSADELAAMLNKEYRGTGWNNKDLSAQIQGIRNKIISGDNSAMKDIEALANEIASGAGSRNVGSTMRALNEGAGGYKYFGVSKKDVSGFGENLKSVNAYLRDVGASFRFRTWPKGGSALSATGAVDKQFGEQYGSPEELFAAVIEATRNYNGHKAYLDEQRAGSDEELAGRVFGDLVDRIYGSTQVDVEAAKNEAKEAAASLKEAAEAAKQVAKETEIAWKGQAGWEREQDKRYREDYSARNVRQQMDRDWRGNAEAAVVDNTAREVAEWRASEDEKYEAYMGQLTEGIVQDRTVGGNVDIKSIIEDATGISRATKDAEDSARAMMDALNQPQPIKSAAESAAVLARELERAENAAKQVEASNEAYKIPDRPGFRSFEEYNGPDLREASQKATEEFDAKLSEIVERPGAMENIKASIHELSAAGIGNTSEVFARLRANNEAIKAREAEEQKIRDAAAAERELNAEAALTADRFMNAVSPADLLQMKLDGVAQQLETALNSDVEDPAKIARLAEQYQKLSDEIREVGNASEEAKKSGITLRGVFDAVGKTLSKSVFGQLARVARMRGLRAIVKSLASAFKEGISNLYQWSKATSGPFAGAMDTIATKTMWAKNSLATALAPAIQALVPVISTVISWVNAASNAIAQFLALLGGKTSWTKATESAQEWAAATKSGASGASKEMKDLLADWDELNIIQSESGGGGGGGGSKAADFKDMFEETNVFDEWTKNFDAIKETVLAIGAAIATWFALSGIEDFLQKIGIGGERIEGVFKRIKKALAGVTLLKIAFEWADDIGEDIAENGFSAKNIAMAALDVAAAGLGGHFLAEAILPGAGVLGTIAGISITLAIGVSAYLAKKRGMTYGQLARNSFATTGFGGFYVEKYKEEVQKELDKQFGSLSVTVTTFIPYKAAKDSLEGAIEGLKGFEAYITGDKKLTKEQAAEFKENWETVFSALNSMHESTWGTINLGIADAMNGESEEMKAQLEEMRQTLIEAQRLTGGAIAGYREEMRQLTGKISSGKSDEVDEQRYHQLADMISESDSSKSLRKMRGWGGEVAGFDFGQGDEAVQNAVNFIDEMGGVYSSATNEVKAWADAQSEAIEAAKDEIDFAYRYGKIDQSQRDKYISVLDEVSGKFKEKVAKDTADIETMKQQTYEQIFEQVLRGFLVNDANGGSVDEYVKQVRPVLDALTGAGYKLPEEWFNGLPMTYSIGGIDFTGIYNALTGRETYSDFMQNVVTQMLKNMMGEGAYKSFLEGLYGKETVEALPVDFEPTIKPESTTEFAKSAKEQVLKELNDADWQHLSDEKMGFSLYYLSGKYGKEAVNEALSELDIPESDINAWLGEAQTFFDENPLKLSFEFDDPDDEDFDIWDAYDVPASSGSSGGGGGSPTAWYQGVPSEGEIDIDATGLATESTMSSMSASITSDLGGLSELVTRATAVLREIAVSSAQTAAKNFTVNVSPSTLLGRVGQKSAGMVSAVTGEG